MKRCLILSFLLIAALWQAKAQYTYVGSSSSLGNNCYQITPAQQWQNGAIWYDQLIDLNEAFHLQFEAFFGNDAGGADGMAFVMQQVSNNILGEDGGGLGFSGFSPSFGVEFDIYQNAGLGDPVFDHLSFMRNGNNFHTTPDNLAGPVQILPGSPNVSDGNNHVVDIFWEPATSTVSVWVDCTPRLSANVDLLQNIFGANPTVYWGFTGATGFLFNQLRVCLDPFILGMPAQYEICKGEEVSLEATGTASGTYSWSPSTDLSASNVNNPTASPEETTTYTVTYADLCGTEQVQSTTVVVYDPIAELGPDVLSCLGETISITPAESNGDLLWSDGSNGTGLEVSASGVYGLTATDGTCTASDEIEVTFSENPTLNLPAEASICEGETFSVNLAAAGLDITWSDGVTGGQRDFTIGGTYTATGTSGACEAQASITIGVAPLPEFELGPDIEACSDIDISLSANAPNADIEWNTGQITPAIVVEQSGYYEATATAGNCSFTDGLDVLILANPSPVIDGENSFCSGEETTLTASGGDSYSWSNGQTGSEINTSQTGLLILTSTFDDTGCAAVVSITLSAYTVPGISLPASITKCQDRIERLAPALSGIALAAWSNGANAAFIDISTPGIYTATVSNACGEASASVEVIDEECFNNLWFPNTFTPNGDGLNELFKVYGEGIVGYQLQIFDRWGSLVFESPDLNDTWNGSHQNGGYYCDSGLYAIRIELEYEGLKVETVYGYVTLLR
jgi:gliding motility-associated-like protein